MSKMDELLSLVKLPYDADVHYRNMETAINEQDELIQQLQQQNQDALYYLKAALEWIDTVPSDTQLPTMPGFDRDEVDALIAKMEGE